MTAGYLPQSDAEDAGDLPQQATAELESAVSDYGTASVDDAAPSNAGPRPQLGESLARDVVEAADNAVAPQLEMAVPAAAPPVLSEQPYSPRSFSPNLNYWMREAGTRGRQWSPARN